MELGSVYTILLLEHSTNPLYLQTGAVRPVYNLLLSIIFHFLEDLRSSGVSAIITPLHNSHYSRDPFCLLGSPAPSSLTSATMHLNVCRPLVFIKTVMLAIVKSPL